MATVYVPGAFLKADMDELVCGKFEGLMAELLSKIDRKIYEKYVVIESGQTVLYAALAHLLYGTLRVSLLFWSKLTGILIDNGYKIIPYDWCMSNKEFIGSQWTVVWQVDDLKRSHLIDNVLTAEIKITNRVFGRQDNPLTDHRGKSHDYLGMTINYSLHEKVNINMFDYIEGFLREIPSSLKYDSVTAAANHFFEVGDDAPMLQPNDTKLCYHNVMRLLWLAKRNFPDLLQPLSYFTTCVQSLNIHDWKKLARTCKYLLRTRNLPLIL